MRKIFLIIGLACTIAAVYLIQDKAPKIPISFDGTWKADMKDDGRLMWVALSPDGKYLAFVEYDESGENHATHTYLYSLDKKTLRPLPTNENGWVQQLFWSPDSTKLAFNHSRPHQYRGVEYGRVLSLKTNSIVREFNIAFKGLAPWSPDGKRLILSSRGGGFVKEVGRPVWTRMEESFGGKAIHWTPDSRGLLYVTPDSGSIMRIDIADGISRRLATLRDFNVNMFAMRPGRRSDVVYLLTSRDKEQSGRRPTVIRKLDMETGKISEVLDTGLDPDKGEFMNNNALHVGPRDDVIYYWERGLIRLDTTTQERETVLDGGFYLWDYSPKEDVFAFTRYEGKGGQSLKLLYARTGKIEHVYSLKLGDQP